MLHGVGFTVVVCRWQQVHADWRNISGELQELKAAFLNSCLSFVGALGWDKAQASSGWTTDDVQVWFGVLGAGDYHPAHVHKNSLVRLAYCQAF